MLASLFRHACYSTASGMNFLKLVHTHCGARSMLLHGMATEGPRHPNLWSREAMRLEACSTTQPYVERRYRRHRLEREGMHASNIQDFRSHLGALKRAVGVFRAAVSFPSLCPAPGRSTLGRWPARRHPIHNDVLLRHRQAAQGRRHGRTPPRQAHPEHPPHMRRYRGPPTPRRERRAR